jgi:hypothetical protein
VEAGPLGQLFLGKVRPPTDPAEVQAEAFGDRDVTSLLRYGRRPPSTRRSSRAA